MASPKLVTLYKRNHRDIATKLREKAKAIRAGDYGTLKSVHVVMETGDGDLVISAFGESDPYRAKGILFEAAAIICTGRGSG